MAASDVDLTKHLQHTTTFFDGSFTATSVTIVICCALALYNALMLLMLVFITFRRFAGLYFWSLLIASAGIIPYVLGFMIEYFRLTAQVAGLVFSTVGWPMMVTGQSLVLFSRLHVVMAKEHRNLLRAVKWMIIVDGIVFHVSTTVVVFGAYLSHPAREFQLAYRYIEKIQMTGFTIQELIISGIYVWRTIDILKISNPDRKRMRRVMWQLFSINVVIIVFDAALLVVEFQNRHVIEQALKQVIYSIKLKFEFAILSKLASLTRQGDAVYLGALEGRDDWYGHSTGASTDQARSHSLALKATDSPHPSICRADSDDAQHVERKASVLTCSGDTFRLDEGASIPQQMPASTFDQQRRRRTLEEDLYAGICKDLAG